MFKKFLLLFAPIERSVIRDLHETLDRCNEEIASQSKIVQAQDALIKSLQEQVKAYRDDRFCQGGCAVYQYDKIHAMHKAFSYTHEKLQDLMLSLMNPHQNLHETIDMASSLLKKLEAFDANKFPTEFDWYGTSKQSLNNTVEGD